MAEFSRSKDYLSIDVLLFLEKFLFLVFMKQNLSFVNLTKPLIEINLHCIKGG